MASAHNIQRHIRGVLTPQILVGMVAVREDRCCVRYFYFAPLRENLFPLCRMMAVREQWPSAKTD